MALRMFAALLAMAAVSAPALAGDVVHPATNEMGYTVHPDHARPGKTRAQVESELEQARQSPSWASIRVGVTPTPFASQLTREQVEADLLRAQQHPSWSTRRVGGAVTMN
ncbi:DUF4148 domain-containing protein [Caenimonas sedimenti]|uniref:DUF4148 domain-containing protein n=1 Tax=Caenimonas sedimenti TaxID=2596921 RepID=A0A562ZII4_9BURK|nr:DUF4148 domain-containing protein [Caenimonas sedimenti]TWO68004.1 DUF4148 domain-containing protein [Caenimonas sedimenti]